MAGYADSAANKQAAEIRREFGGRIDSLETGLNTFSTQLATADSKMERQHSEILQAVKSNSKGGYGKGGGQGNKGKWRGQQQPPLQPRFQMQRSLDGQQQQQQQWQHQPQWQQQQQQAPQASWQSTVPAPRAAVACQTWANGRKPFASWGCGGPHIERNCPNKGIVDASIAATRHGADVCSLALSGDDSGEATLEEVEGRFGGIDEVRGFVNAVRTQSDRGNHDWCSAAR